MKNSYDEFTTKMDKAISFLNEEYDTVRAGRANPAVLQKVMVEYYGVATPLQQVATISVPEPRILSIAPWDASLVKEIEKALLKSEVGITPVTDGKTIRLAFPPPTEERRKELVKTVTKKAEDARVVIRGIRRDALEFYKKQQKASEITEDDLKGIEKDIQDLTDTYVKKIDEIAKNKEKEILEI